MGWLDVSCVAVVLAAEGYPGEVRQGGGAERAGAGGWLAAHRAVPCRTELQGGAVVAVGGRVLSVCGTGADEAQATRAAYLAVDAIGLPGVQGSIAAISGLAGACGRERTGSDAAGDGARSAAHEGHAAGVADRLHHADGAAAGSALRRAAGGGFAGHGAVWPAEHAGGDPGDDDRAWGGRGARRAACVHRGGSAVRQLPAEPAAGVRQRRAGAGRDGGRRQ